MNRIAMVTVGVLLLAACGDDPQAPKTTVFDDQLGALKKAEQVEDKLKTHADALNQAVETAGDQPASDR